MSKSFFILFTLFFVQLIFLIIFIPVLTESFSNNNIDIDLSIRMRSIFDYYLLEKSSPKWLIDGIPMTVKVEEY